MQIVKGDESVVKITPQNVTKYLGPPRVVREEETSSIAQVGIVNGLAWTETGGETLQIEVNTMPGKGKVQLTGQLGDVMKESAAAALSYIRSHAQELGFKDTPDGHSGHSHSHARRCHSQGRLRQPAWH